MTVVAQFMDYMWVHYHLSAIAQVVIIAALIVEVYALVQWIRQRRNRRPS